MIIAEYIAPHDTVGENIALMVIGLVMMIASGTSTIIYSAGGIVPEVENEDESAAARMVRPVENGWGSPLPCTVASSPSHSCCSGVKCLLDSWLYVVEILTARLGCADHCRLQRSVAQSIVSGCRSSPATRDDPMPSGT